MFTIDNASPRGGRGALGMGTILLLAVLAACLVAWAADARLVEGRPVWEKPTKFALAFAVHLSTLWCIAWWTQRQSALFHWSAVVTVAVSVVEFAAIALQASRGERSHFNVATPFDAAVFTVMGIGIGIQTAAGFVMAYDVFVRPGMRIVPARIAAAALIVGSLGALTGMLMVRPTTEQLASIEAGTPSGVSGQRFIGGQGEGARLPFFGWSLEHGDLRVPHFLGVHGLQAILVFGAVLTAFRGKVLAHAQGAVLAIGACAYLGLTAVLSYQALRGEAFVTPSGPVAAAWGALAAVSAAALAVALINAYWHVSSGAADRSA